MSVYLREPNQRTALKELLFYFILFIYIRERLRLPFRGRAAIMRSKRLYRLVMFVIYSMPHVAKNKGLRARRRYEMRTPREGGVLARVRGGELDTGVLVCLN